MNNQTKKILKHSIFYPVLLIKRGYERYLRKYNPPKLIKFWYKINTGISLNIENPQTLDEKIYYMSFYTDTKLWSELSDKVRVRDYVKRKGFPEILNELYAVYESPEDINFNLLPDKFVLKTNNGSATNILVRDKNLLDLPAIKSKLSKWMKIDYGYETATPHYSLIKPLILAEKYLVEDNDINKVIVDYKFYCIHGKPIYVIVYSDRVINTHNTANMLYDTNWTPRPEFISKGVRIASVRQRPLSYNRMLKIAEILSEPFPFVRVDFYEIDGKPIFGEMTFTPGHSSEMTYDFIKQMGLLINFDFIKK